MAQEQVEIRKGELEQSLEQATETKSSEQFGSGTKS